MRKSVVASVAGAIALAAAGFGLAAEANVALTQTGPDPADLTVAWGDTVVFTNSSGVDQNVQIPRIGLTTPTIPPAGTAAVPMTGPGGSYNFSQVAGKGRASGRIVVQISGSVTLDAGKGSVPFGQSLTLRGRSTVPNSQVTVQQRSFDQREWSDFNTVTPGTDGTFSLAVAPKIGGQYRATAAGGQVTSSPASVRVAPQLRIQAKRRVAGKRALVLVRITPADAARRVQIEQFLKQRGGFVVVDSKPVRSGSAVFAVAVGSGTTRVRASIRRPDTAPGYDAATSKPVTIRG